ETINITDSKFFHGNLIVKEGTLNFDGSGGFTGSVSTGGPVIVKGDAKITTPLLYAPNSTVEVLGGEFKGPIIGGTVTIGGPTASNPRVYYDPPGTPVPIPGSGDSGQANITEDVAREQ
ncbi:MAG: hypothetical protein QM217_06340, partial [Bacillota bacterium]|nr:hypothetical protein [Bacillota bacterium]